MITPEEAKAVREKLAGLARGVVMFHAAVDEHFKIDKGSAVVTAAMHLAITAHMAKRDLDEVFSVARIFSRLLSSEANATPTESSFHDAMDRCLNGIENYAIEGYLENGREKTRDYIRKYGEEVASAAEAKRVVAHSAALATAEELQRERAARQTAEDELAAAKEVGCVRSDHAHFERMRTEIAELKESLELARAAAIRDNPETANAAAKMERAVRMANATITRRQAEITMLKNILKPFADLGGPWDAKAFPDLEDDIVVYANSGTCITAGDVRMARNALKEDS